MPADLPPLRVLLTGGAGYIGAVLTPKLLVAGHAVTVLDALWYGPETLGACAENPRFSLVQADLRDHAEVRRVLREGAFDALIHLASISNDPSSELDPDLTREVNLVALEHLFRAAKEAGVRRVLYASSASVYGVKQTPDVHEGLPLEPMTLYARYKAEGEDVLRGLLDDRCCGVAVRAATVCGYSPRLRLDLTINILTSFGYHNGAIRVFGGAQQRPNVHVEDLTDFYVSLLRAPRDLIQGEAFNVCRENATVMELAALVQAELGEAVRIEVVPTDDNRSYHLSAEKVARVLGFRAQRPLVQAVRDLRAAFDDGRVPDWERAWYRNVAWMKLHPELCRFPAR
ncbi:MAG: SDR family oxidoreductase [Pseudomonadota bacterium]